MEPDMQGIMAASVQAEMNMWFSWSQDRIKTEQPFPFEMFYNLVPVHSKVGFIIPS